MSEFYNIKSRNELADLLNIPRKHLTYVLYVQDVNNLYTSFELPKKNGGSRKINAPLDVLKDIQRKLAKALYNRKEMKLKKSHVSHAFEKDKGIITNAEIHRNKRFVMNIDLEDFFESFHFGRVRGFFLKNNNFSLSKEVATVIAQISCYQGRLPQGAPSSPVITNLICEILDHRVLKLAKKHKLNYTRYADDLTFSTNDKNFLDLQIEFYENLTEELIRAGFKINEKKTRLQFRDSRQVVTGLVVNKQLNVNRNYYKETRAMAHQLYKHGNFHINGETATINQLEGRFSFINQLTWYNNNRNNNGKHTHFKRLKSRERQFQKFLFYKYFFANPKPLIVTEGKTDIVYLKSALKKRYNEYPDLITKNSDGTFEFKVSFLKKTKRLSYFLGIYKDGASALNNIYSFFDSNKKSTVNYLSYFNSKSNSLPRNPVILMFDNEIESGKKKPIGQFIGSDNANLNNKKQGILEREYMVNIIDNLYLLTVPLIDEKSECDIEDLFEENTLLHKIGGKGFNKKNDFETENYYGKEIFSNYISSNYLNINFNEFKSLLDNINYIIDIYTKEPVDTERDFEAENTEQASTDKVPLEV